MMIIIKTPDHKLLISPHYLQIKIQIAQAAFQIRSLFQSHFPLALNMIPSFRRTLSLSSSASVLSHGHPWSVSLALRSRRTHLDT